MRTQIEERQKQNGPVALIGESKRIQSIRHAIHKISGLKNQPTVVLISGETGVGKDVVARLIHQKRGNGHAYVPLNCSAMPQDLLENELFGHVKGGFTGATEKKEGLFHHSQDGTLFMDEIGEMPLSLQAKLLRVLEDRKFRRVGATHEEQISARHIVFATNQDLKQRVDQKQFREDLFFRINHLEIVVPPLRDRPEDIPCLIEHLCRTHPDTRPMEFSPEAINLLLRYPWPGNVRELKTVVQRCLVLERSDVIEPVDLVKLYPVIAIFTESSKCKKATHNNRFLPCWIKSNEEDGSSFVEIWKECRQCAIFQFIQKQEFKNHPMNLGTFALRLLNHSEMFKETEQIDLEQISLKEYKNLKSKEAEKQYLKVFIKKYGKDRMLLSEKLDCKERNIRRLLKEHGF